MRNIWFFVPSAALGCALALSACTSTPLTDDSSTGETTGDETPTGNETPTGDGDGDTDTNPTGPTTTSGDGDALTLYEIQQGLDNGSVGVGQIVSVSGVIVTTPVEAELGLVFVEETDAGEWSGISLYLYDEVVMAHNLVPGDEVDISGELADFFGMSQIVVTSPAGLTVISSANALPGPDIVAAADVARDNAAAEPWEGVRVCIDDAVIVEANDGFGQYLLQDNALISYAFVGGMLPEAAPGGSFTQICGSLHYSFDEFKVQPASLDDLVGYQGPNASDTTVADIQMGNVAENSVVRVSDVVVTSGFTFSLEADASFYVQDAGGGEWSGIQVFIADTAGVSLSPGDVITLEGMYTEFFDMSQISIAGAASITAQAGGPAPTPTLVDDPASIATGGAATENYEGCLVQVGPVTVTDENPDAPEEFGEFAVDGELRVDDVFFDMNDWTKPALDTDYTSITGLLGYSYNNSKLQPRDNSDLVQP